MGTETNDPKSTLRNFQAFKDIVVKGVDDTLSVQGLTRSIAFNELGNAWMLNKEWAKARECFLESIRLTKSKSDYDPTDISFPMVNLGLAHWMTGKLDEALAVLEEGLQHREDKFGKDDKVSFV